MFQLRNLRLSLVLLEYRVRSKSGEVVANRLVTNGRTLGDSERRCRQFYEQPPDLSSHTAVSYLTMSCCHATRTQCDMLEAISHEQLHQDVSIVN